MHSTDQLTPEGRATLVVRLENERAAIQHMENCLRRDPAGFDQMDTLVEHCHRYRNLATVLELWDGILQR